MEGERGGGGLEQASFAQTLGSLKQEGSNILLVGRETADAHTTICDRLLGESGDASRYRLLVTDERERASETRGESDDDTVREIDYSELEFTGSGNADLSGRTPLGTLGIEIIETIDELEAAADGLEPSQLRVCLDSLVPLLEDHRAEKVFRLLHMTTSRVGHVQGMGHYHLSLERDHEAVHLFEPLFDAVVEIRVRDGTHEQRWELRDNETTTDWIPV